MLPNSPKNNSLRSCAALGPEAKPGFSCPSK